MLTPEQILVDLVRLDTVNPPGNEIRVARYLKEICDAAGIKNEIIEAGPGRGNFWACLGAGESPQRLLYLAHSDVVPVGEGWDYDPFAGERHGSLIYGRGTRDCKGLLAAELYTLLRLAREQTKLKGTLLFAATADEERGGKYGIRYLLEHCPEKLQADFAVNEGGEEPIIMHGRTFFFFQVGEKGTAASKLLARGISCHGAIPTLGDNAVTKMAAALHALAGYRAEIRLVPEVQFTLQELARAAGLEMAVTADNTDLLLEKLAAADRDFTESLRAMTRMTVSPNVVQGGSKSNVVPDTCRAQVDIRILPGQDEEYVRRELARYLGGDMEIEIPNYHAPTFSTAASPYYRLLVETTEQVAGREITCLPQISPGATDSRHLRGAGIPSFGIGHMVPGFDPEGRSTLHGRNERIDMGSLQLKAEFLYRLARSYLS